MRYSLTSRVKGLIIGAYWGEILSNRREKQSQSFDDLGKMALLGTESLISLGKLDVDDWLNRQQAAGLDFTHLDDFWGQIMLATLPVAIFYQEDSEKLRENLLRILQAWEVDPMIRDGTLAVGFAIAQSLTERLNPQTLILQTIAFLGRTSTSLPAELSKINTLLQQKSLLGKMPTPGTLAVELNQNNITKKIAQIFYYFLNTLEDFRLTLLQPHHHHSSEERNHPSFLAINVITGALSGAYNSINGIPVNWQVLSSPTNSPVWGLSSFAQMIELGDILLAVWSGAYHLYPDNSWLTDEKSAVLRDSVPCSIFAAPRVIRPR